MNVPAALVAITIGAIFFATAHFFDYRMPTFEFDILSSDNSKARAAVARLLFKPGSAEYSNLRSVQVERAKYVCGQVKARDKQDTYVGPIAFVYTVAIDFAHIDDNSRIAQPHQTFKACPVSEKDEAAIAANQQLDIFARQLQIAAALQKGAPPADLSKLSAMADQLSRSSGQAGPAQSLDKLGNSVARPGATTSQGSGSQGSGSQGLGSQGTNSQGSGAPSLSQADRTKQASADSNSKSKDEPGRAATLEKESEWSTDRPPAAWPNYSPPHPLSKPGLKRRPVEAIIAAMTVEERLHRSKQTKTARPSADEIDDALRSLLAIDPKSDEYPLAWAAFVRLKRISQEVG